MIGCAVLVGRLRNLTLAPKPETLAELRARHLELERQWRERYGYRFDGLTESEARWLRDHWPA
jgi:hypothetical protein